MKLVCLVLAVLVLALSLTPCCGLGDGCDDRTEQGAGTHNKACAANCSPFFACGSCSGFSVYAQSTDLFISPPTAPAPPEPHYTASLAKLSMPIWQPPQLRF